MRRALLVVLVVAALAASAFLLLRDGDAGSKSDGSHYGAIDGRVQKNDRPSPAEVVLHHVEALADVDPLGVWRGASFLDRILDGGSQWTRQSLG